MLSKRVFLALLALAACFAGVRPLKTNAADAARGALDSLAVREAEPTSGNNHADPAVASGKTGVASLLEEMNDYKSLSQKQTKPLAPKQSNDKKVIPRPSSQAVPSVRSQWEPWSCCRICPQDPYFPDIDAIAGVVDPNAEQKLSTPTIKPPPIKPPPGGGEFGSGGSPVSDQSDKGAASQLSQSKQTAGPPSEAATSPAPSSPGESLAEMDSSASYRAYPRRAQRGNDHQQYLEPSAGSEPEELRMREMRTDRAAASAAAKQKAEAMKREVAFREYMQEQGLFDTIKNVASSVSNGIGNAVSKAKDFFGNLFGTKKPPPPPPDAQNAAQQQQNQPASKKDPKFPSKGTAPAVNPRGTNDVDRWGCCNICPVMSIPFLYSEAQKRASFIEEFMSTRQKNADGGEYQMTPAEKEYLNKWAKLPAKPSVLSMPPCCNFCQVKYFQQDYFLQNVGMPEPLRPPPIGREAPPGQNIEPNPPVAFQDSVDDKAGAFLQLDDDADVETRQLLSHDQSTSSDRPTAAEASSDDADSETRTLLRQDGSAGMPRFASSSASRPTRSQRRSGGDDDGDDDDDDDDDDDGSSRQSRHQQGASVPPLFGGHRFAQKGFFQDAWNKVKSVGSSIVSSVKNVASNIGNAIGGLFGGAANKASQMGAALSQSIDKLFGNKAPPPPPPPPPPPLVPPPPAPSCCHRCIRANPEQNYRNRFYWGDSVDPEREWYPQD